MFFCEDVPHVNDAGTTVAGLVLGTFTAMTSSVVDVVSGLTLYRNVSNAGYVGAVIANESPLVLLGVNVAPLLARMLGVLEKYWAVVPGAEPEPPALGENVMSVCVVAATCFVPIGSRKTETAKVATAVFHIGIEGVFRARDVDILVETIGGVHCSLDHVHSFSARMANRARDAPTWDVPTTRSKRTVTSDHSPSLPTRLVRRHRGRGRV